MLENRPCSLELDQEEIIVRSFGPRHTYIKFVVEPPSAKQTQMICITTDEIIPVVLALATSEAGRKHIPKLLAELLRTEAAQDILCETLQREYQQALGIHEVDGGFQVNTN